MKRQRVLAADDRAIEGLPIRLVIALVVGVAALGIMMNMLGGLGTPEQTEVRVEYPNGAVVESSSAGSQTVKVVGEDGQAVPNAQVIVTAGTAEMDGAVNNETNDNGEATVDISGAELRSDQNKGTLTVEVVPPSDSDWVDEQTNTEIVIVDG